MALLVQRHGHAQVDLSGVGLAGGTEDQIGEIQQGWSNVERLACSRRLNGRGLQRDWLEVRLVLAAKRPIRTRERAARYLRKQSGSEWRT
jgi:hypothetical protein